MAKFKSRARTVDMLGRQQIANISTAISELFKNAHDAYAENAEVDYFRSDNLMVIRDNGFGMTPQEFEDRWLVLGTESKFSLKGGEKEAYRPSGKPERAIMGEKGIGRLAIALLGRQVLVLTRARRGEKQHDLLMCYIHWQLFELPGLNLDEIEIPIKIIPGGQIPTAEDVNEMLDEMRGNVEGLAHHHDQGMFTGIFEDLKNLQIDPEDLDEFLGGLSLRGEGCGTHFYIAPADEGIATEIEEERQKETKDFSKFLLGFSNSVFRENPPPPIETAFRYWATESVSEDLIGDGEFFTEEELEMADHRISGKFDEYGQFCGDVRVYEQITEDHIISWKDGGGRATRCGPFEIEFGYVAGYLKDSVVPPEEWKRMVSKLEAIGGIYVYRDRIRILPYGNSDIDWLDVEQRRNKGAGYYFFSYRRLFGAVKLTRKKNYLLREKAGREGFQQDKAYRQLKEILVNFFIQLAADFFRADAGFSDYFDERKSELNRLEKARQKREKQVGTKKKKLAAKLESFFENVKGDKPHAEITSLRELIFKRLADAAAMPHPDDASEALLAAEKEASNKLAEVREKYHLSKPRGIGLNRDLQRSWQAYTEQFRHMEKELFDPFSREVAETLGEMAREAELYIDQRKRLSELLKQQADSGEKMVKKEAGEVRYSARDARDAALKVAHNAIREMQKTIAEVESDFAHMDLVDLSYEEIESLRAQMENRIESVGRRNSENLNKVRDMLTTISSNLQEGGDLMELDMVEALDQELQELREQSDADAEMVQLGLAVAVINHEFEAAIKGVRRTLKELRPWARANDDLSILYQDLRNNFEHLDGHLSLFTPLQRRLYRKAISIKGSDIYHYLQTLFEVRLKRHQVKLEATQVFLDAEIISFPSTVYPVFVNLSDNAIFWLKSLDTDKKIVLDAEDGAFLFSNNGPAIRARDYEAIFEQGFTRKPGGRGLGLYISRRALQKEGMNIEVVPSKDKYGVTMKIKWPDYDEAS